MKKIMIISLIIIGVIILTFVLVKMYLTNEIIGINNYDKNYYLREYGNDLDSNLTIFPDSIDNLIGATFKSSFRASLFDIDGYILLTSKYTKENFDNEINRLKDINITISETCYKDSKTFTNYIKYDAYSYEYPAYIAIDGFDSTYEYALINEKDLEIIYVYLSYPNNNDINYKKYLMKDKTKYSKTDTLSLFSIYSHSFDDGSTYNEYDDCK